MNEETLDTAFIESKSQIKSFYARNKVFFTEIFKYLDKENSLEKNGYFYLSDKILLESADCSSVRQGYSQNISADDILKELTNKWDDTKYKLKSHLIYDSICNIIPIESVSDLLRFIEKYEYDEKNEQLYFRGQSNFGYSLKPSLFRNENLLKHEDDIKNDVCQMYPELHKEKGLNLKAYFQHYGLPTELLDVTRNPLAALFFACFVGEDKQNKNEDGRVLIFRIKNTEITVIGNKEEPLNNSKSESGYKCIRTNFNSERIKHQDGAFLYCEKDSRIRDSLENENRTLLLITKDNKEKILKELRLLGIDEYFIYPEFEHFCKAIRHKYS